MRVLLVALAVFAAVNAKAVIRRQAQNSYGDEAAPAVEVAQPAAPAPAEQTVEVVEQPAAAPEVQSADSGYRAKRQTQNSYGDEAPAAPAAEVSQPAAPAPVEQTVEVVEQPAAAPEVQSADSGYRAKRQAQNSYGDEAAPAGTAGKAAQPIESAPVEQAAEPAYQPAAAAPEVQSADSGYRAKRQAQNSYGDEAAPAGTAGEAAQPIESAPVEQAAEPAYQPAAAAPEVQSADSGYRAKRQTQNSYGDEAPAAAVGEPATPSEPAPVEQTVEVVEQPAAAPEVQSADSGYRAKRQAQNSYGDEAAPAGTAGEAAQPIESAPVEQAAEPAYQPAAAAPEVQSADSGYRAKRQTQNSYGDESPAAPAAEVSQPAAPAPVEQTVEVVEQPAAAPEVQSADSGYRAKRQAQNSYGDEAAPAGTAGEAAQPIESAPVEQAAEPAYQPAAAAPEVQSADSGYRA
ncbi:unnamed protein product [Caenorhabditis angaria]|uniref:Uncharacterized protein n=1 Tax=Caenorhabditis angaria TaxID=860376 RepID=A0A9P1N4C8_9PELO|nr:unnamed protein product [Caenorhabditis angaria]